MLSTIELKDEIEKRIYEKLPQADFKQVNFCEGGDNSPEGIYVFNKAGKYHFLFTEKGKVRYDRELEDVSEVLWNVLDMVLFDVAMDYALKNRIQGKDFRRPLFEREIELYSMFGGSFKERKIEEIRKVLEENPYCDQ